MTTAPHDVPLLEGLIQPGDPVVQTWGRQTDQLLFFKTQELKNQHKSFVRNFIQKRPALVTDKIKYILIFIFFSMWGEFIYELVQTENIEVDLSYAEIILVDITLKDVIQKKYFNMGNTSSISYIDDSLVNLSEKTR